MAVSIRPVRQQLDQENEGIVRRKGLKTPAKGLGVTNEGRQRASQTVKDAGRVLNKSTTATDVGPQRLFKDTLTTQRKALLTDKTNKTLHASASRPEAGPSKDAASPVKEAAFQKAQLVASPRQKTPAKVALARSKTNKLSPVVQPNYNNMKTPSPNLDAKRRGERAPFTPPSLDVPEKPMHESDIRRAIEWETLEEREVEYAAGPTAIPREPEGPGLDSILTNEFLADWAEMNYTFPMHIPAIPQELPYDFADLDDLSDFEVSSNDGFLTDEETDESEEEAITPPRPLSNRPHSVTTSSSRSTPMTSSRLPTLNKAFGQRGPLGRTSSVVVAPNARATKLPRSASVTNTGPPSVTTLGGRTMSATSLRTVTPAHSRNASTTSQERKLPSFMMPTAASLAKKPVASPPRPSSQKSSSKEAPTQVSKEASKEVKLTAKETDKSLKSRRRRPIFGPHTAQRTAELEAEEAERQEELKRLDDLLASYGIKEASLDDYDPFSSEYDVYIIDESVTEEVEGVNL